MIKFTAESKNGILVGLGLTAKNLELLKQGKPISFEGAELGIPRIDFLIMYGENEKKIHEQLQEYIGPQTVVKGKPNDPA